MAISYDALTEILTTGKGHFEIIERGKFGRVHVYRGRDAADFRNRTDNRQHEHKVYDGAGRLRYHRDINGRVLVGSELQKQDGRRKHKSGVISVREAFQRALNMYR